MRYLGVVLAVTLGGLGLSISTGCRSEATSPSTEPTAPTEPARSDISLNFTELAEAYLVLELGMAEHDPVHVDAYFGPDALRAQAKAEARSIAAIEQQAGELSAQLAEALPRLEGDDALRARALKARLRALRTRIELAEGQKLSFDEESERLFGASAPDYDASHFQAILAEIDQLIPGDGPLAARVERFRSQFVIPGDKLASVFEAAIAECRRRTLAHVELPEGESFVVEYVTDKPWSGYNWYKGQAHSVIQVNTDLPIFISRAVDLGCHEGYPGHHTYNALIEDKLVKQRGWLENSLYPLFSPQSLIAEGSGNYGIELAFPGEERVEYEKRVLFPLAGLDVSQADRYYQLMKLEQKLNYAGNEAARDYLNGDIPRAAAVQWLVDFTLSSPERASKRTEFFDAYRSYVINYNLGKDLVAEFVERGGADLSTRWARFEGILSLPLSAAELEAPAASD